MDDTDAYVVTMFLNPAMRLSWIQAEWEGHYIRRAKDIILALMRQYRSQKSSMSEATMTDSPVQPDPVVSVAPTRFKVQDSVYKKKSTRNVSSVDVEFQKYVSGPISSEETNILRFWEANRLELPTLFSIAMDYLPIQATPILMEALQMLKYSLKKERLNFMNGWSISKAAMSMSVPTGELSSLFVDDPVVSFDNLLNDLINYDNCES
ncbi:hypothetical protein F5888DRAFT_1802387 [Russula emetica]|nr:hypothetical protein F5888DRAFT_1802387 [Russula emetica]